ncbi:MAG: alpha-E domain-containing protein, partial [Alphaproteobacteria bacterium]|nr:alpha-E domain-containing protein [Alphaproteobacteria bacterium]
MLSRTAENIYWLARYVERAENIARLLDVALRMSAV